MPKLSEIFAMDAKSGAQAMAIVTPYIANLANNPVIEKFFQAKSSKTLSLKFFLGCVVELLPSIIADNYDDVVAITAYFTGATTKEIEKYSLAKLIVEVKSFVDNPFIDLFTSSVASEQAK